MITELIKQLSLGLFGILPGNYSGITHVADNEYAVVDDKDRTDGFKILTLDIDTQKKPKIIDAQMAEPKGMAERRRAGQGVYRDCEGVAFCKSTNTIFVSGEEDQRIVEYTLDGMPTGRELAIPQSLSRSNIRPNLGFEALAYNDVTKCFWTTTESTIPADGECSSLTSTDMHNRLRFIRFGLSLQPEGEAIYMMDKPTVKHNKGTYAHGVPSLIAMDDGTLLVMEREAYVAPKKVGSFCRIKIFRAVAENGEMRKTLLTEFVTRMRIGKLNFSNYEGMCIGPQLADGRQTLILIADSQNRAGNALYHLRDNVKIVII